MHWFRSCNAHGWVRYSRPVLWSCVSSSRELSCGPLSGHVCAPILPLSHPANAPPAILPNLNKESWLLTAVILGFHDDNIFRMSACSLVKSSSNSNIGSRHQQGFARRSSLTQTRLLTYEQVVCDMKGNILVDASCIATCKAGHISAQHVVSSSVIVTAGCLQSGGHSCPG